MPRHSPLVVLVGTLVLPLAACGGSATPEDEVRVALQFPPRAGYAFDADDGGLLTKLGVAEPLVGLGRFALRDGVVFHDGARLDADAVVTALRYVSSRPTPPRPIDGIGLQVAAEGPGTVVATTAVPTRCCRRACPRGRPRSSPPPPTPPVDSPRR